MFVMREVGCCQLGVYIPLLEFAEFPSWEDFLNKQTNKQTLLETKVFLQVQKDRDSHWSWQLVSSRSLERFAFGLCSAWYQACRCGRSMEIQHGWTELMRLPNKTSAEKKQKKQASYQFNIGHWAFTYWSECLLCFFYIGQRMFKLV